MNSWSFVELVTFILVLLSIIGLLGAAVFLWTWSEYKLKEMFDTPGMFYVPFTDAAPVIEHMNQKTRDWEDKAARGECPWICSDCCVSFPEGMPDACPHGSQHCTYLIQRDKKRALA